MNLTVLICKLKKHFGFPKKCVFELKNHFGVPKECLTGSAPSDRGSVLRASRGVENGKWGGTVPYGWGVVWAIGIPPKTTLAPERNRSRRVLATPKTLWRPSGIVLEWCWRRPKHSGARAESRSKGACDAQNTLAPERNGSRGLPATPKPLWQPSGIALEGCLRRPNHSGSRAESLPRGACDAQTTLAAEQNRSRVITCASQTLWQPSRIVFGWLTEPSVGQTLGGKKLIHFWQKAIISRGAAALSPNLQTFSLWVPGD